MGYFLFLVKDHRDQGKVIKAEEVLENRVKYRFWSFSKRAGNLKSLKRGDQILFYLAGRQGRRIVGRGVVASNPYPMSDLERDLALGSPSKKYDYVVDLMDVELWPVAVDFEKVYEHLSFIRDKGKPYLYLQGSIKRLSEEDFNLICNTAKLLMSSISNDGGAWNQKEDGSSTPSTSMPPSEGVATA